MFKWKEWGLAFCVGKAGFCMYVEIAGRWILFGKSGALFPMSQKRNAIFYVKKAGRFAYPMWKKRSGVFPDAADKHFVNVIVISDSVYIGINTFVFQKSRPGRLFS